jgi:hypothetical protein
MGAYRRRGEEGYRRRGEEGKCVFVGVDLHRFKWHVTVRSEDEEVFSGTVPGHWEALRRLLDRYRGCSIHVAYEAGYFGFWLYDRWIRASVARPEVINAD